MKRIKLIGLVLLALTAVNCGGGPAGGPSSGNDNTATNNSNTATSDGSAPQLDKELSVYNWPDYIDESILKDYEAQYGVHIIYDTYASNEDLLAKLQAGATGYDVIMPSDYMVAQMIQLNLLAEIDTAQMPNFANIMPEFANAPFDPGNKHCVPYQWGTTGLAYRDGNPYFMEHTPDSWAYLFEPDLLKNYSGGGINVLDDQREVFSAALFYLGYSPNTVDRAQLEQARDLILKAKPFWKTFNSSDYDFSLLIPDEVVFSQSWSGDAAQARWDTYDEATGTTHWHYAIPKEGAVKWMDNVCITANSQRKETAVHFINFLLDAQNAAKVTNFTYFGSPNKAAQAFITPDIMGDPGIFPPAETLAKLQWLVDLGDGIFVYDEMWTAVKGQ